MSVLIKSMFMPESCVEWGNRGCPFLDTEINDNLEDGFDFICTMTENVIDNTLLRPKWCPLVEVHTPHGRLIDEDEILPKHDRKKGIVYCGNLAEITTVIEAED